MLEAGRAAAIAYAREGADVTTNYLPVEQPDAEEVKKLIEKEGRKAVLIPGDLRSEDLWLKKPTASLANEISWRSLLVNSRL